MNQKTKQILIIVAVIIVAFVGYQMFFSNSTPADSTLVADQAPATQFVDGQTILALLDSLNLVTLDNSVFTNKTFVSLLDFERPIQDQVVGRPNPFLPIGVDGSGTILPKGTSTATSTSRAR